MSSLADLCDVSLTLLSEQITQVALAAISAGAELTLGEALQELQNALNAPLGAADSPDPERYELMQALGLVV